MPINYPQPNWIRPADPAANYGKGFGLGLHAGQAQAQINMERARLAEAQNRTQVEIALRQQELQRQSMIDQQKLEVDKAYKAQQFALGQQELSLKEQEFQKKVQEAAQRTMMFDRYRAAIAAGEKPTDAALKNLMGVVGMGPVLAQSMRAQVEDKLYKPETISLPGFPPAMYSPKTGTPHFAPADRTPKVTFEKSMDALNKAIQMSPKTFEKLGLDTNALKVLQQAALANVQQAASGNKGAVATQQEILPLPAKKSELITGKRYQTRYGPAVWNGSDFTSEIVPMDDSQPEPPDEPDLDADRE